MHTKRSDVRVTEFFIVFVVCVVCGMIMKVREKDKPGAGTQPTPVDKHQGDHQV